MRSSVALGALVVAPAVLAAPFTFPLPNGYPEISLTGPVLAEIQETAQGTIPNAPLLTSLAPEDILNWQVVAFNEIFEVAFYSSLIDNITNAVPGYELPPADKAFALEALEAILAQEELHYLGANAIVTTAGGEAILPCEYVFPSVSYDTAIDFARTFTDVVLGVLAAVQLAHSEYGDPEYIPLIGSVLGQEAEQVGWFRTELDLIPSETPFLTAATGSWGYSALNQLVIVPGSCPNKDIIDAVVPIYPPLLVETSPILPKDQYVEYAFPGAAPAEFYLVLVNQQNLPLVEKPKHVWAKGGYTYFKALFPYEEYLLNGLTIAVVTSSAGPFTNAAEVEPVTLYGPGLIQVN